MIVRNMGVTSWLILIKPGEGAPGGQRAYYRLRNMRTVPFLLQSIRELQSSVRDGVVLFKALLDELRKNTDAEKNAVTSMADSLQDTVMRAQDVILLEVSG